MNSSFAISSVSTLESSNAFYLTFDFSTKSRLKASFWSQMQIPPPGGLVRKGISLSIKEQEGHEGPGLLT